jgi:hypothetical protein
LGYRFALAGEERKSTNESSAPMLLPEQDEKWTGKDRLQAVQELDQTANRIRTL